MTRPGDCERRPLPRGPTELQGRSPQTCYSAQNLQGLESFPIRLPFLPESLPLLILECIFQDNRVGHDLLAELQAREHFLHLVRQHFSTADFYAAEFPVRRRLEHPVAVLKVHDRRGRNLRVCFSSLSVECCCCKHAD